MGRCYTAIFSERDNNGDVAIAPIDEVPIEKELIDDAVSSTSQEQHLVIKTEESIDIKHEPLIIDDDDDVSLHLVGLHVF
jgi:hypothetical protein